MDEIKQFVSVPNEVVDCDEINPKTLVVYCAIKRHLNKETNECFPAISTICKEAGCGKDLALRAIDELEENGFITVIKRKGQSNIYRFSTHKTFEPFSYDFLDDKKLKIREKAYLIAQQKNMYVKKDSGVGITSLTTKELAKRTHMSIPTLLSCENKLMQIGYLSKPDSLKLDPESNTNEKFRLFLLELYNTSALVFRQTQHNTEEIELLKKENAELKRQIEILKRAVFKDSDPNIVL